MNDTPEQNIKDNDNVGYIFFWIFWAILLLLLPFYAFTAWIEINLAKPNNVNSQLSGIIGVFVLIAQIVVFAVSFKAARQKQLARASLWLFGASIITAMVWVGGCALMGPLNIK